MDEDFVTDGLESNRYLKADKLVQEFREQIREELEEVSDQIVKEHPALFNDDVNINYGDFGVENSRTLSTIRVEFGMESEHEEYGTRLLNIALEWVKPEKQEQENVSDGALCYVLYKIQRGSENRFEKVRHQTIENEQWNEIRFREDQWPYKRKEAPGIVSIPVTTGPEIAEALQTLQEHFSQEYAPKLLY